MTTDIADVTSYLVEAGWRRQPEEWRGASIWIDDEGREVLVPAHGDAGDSAMRVRDIVDVLSIAERRTADEIVRDIDSPLIDNQHYRTFPETAATGETTLADGLHALRGVHDLLDAAARAAASTQSLTYPDRAGDDADDLLRHVRLRPARSGSDVLTVGVPADQALGRQAGKLLREAILAVEMASNADSGRPVPEDLIVGGVSARMCAALSELAGPNRQQPFEVSFRWARDVTSAPVPTTVRFGTGAGETIRAMGERLLAFGDRGAATADPPEALPDVEYEATLTGLVDGLHDDASRRDRWRVRVRGELVTADQSVSSRAVWVRFDDDQTYDRAITAHRRGARVRARGALTRGSRRLELHTDSTRFELLD